MNKYKEALEDLLDYLQEYHNHYHDDVSFENRKLLKELVEKATPKKVDIIGDYNCICTNCENALGKETLEFGLSKMYRWARAYCPYCGQALDWSEDDENG